MSAIEPRVVFVWTALVQAPPLLSLGVFSDYLSAVLGTFVCVCFDLLFTFGFVEQASFQRANVLMSMERYNEALRELEVVRDNVPKESAVYFLMGKVRVIFLFFCFYCFYV